jgi:hypothetical protein
MKVSQRRREKIGAWFLHRRPYGQSSCGSSRVTAFSYSWFFLRPLPDGLFSLPLARTKSDHRAHPRKGRSIPFLPEILPPNPGYYFPVPLRGELRYKAVKWRPVWAQKIGFGS